MCCGSSSVPASTGAKSGSWYGSSQPVVTPDGPFEVTFPDRTTATVDTYQDAEALVRARGGGIRRKAKNSP